MKIIHISAMNGFVVMIFELDLITLEKFICDKMVVVNLKIFLEILMVIAW